ncbi:MAG: hypothetical protein WBN31_13745 [Gammaproteobacteria bacterium]
MHNELIDSQDQRLRQLFSQGLEAPIDDGFTDRVMGRIKRRVLVRKSVLTTATLIGGLVALGPAYELSLAISSIVSQATSGWSGADWLPQTRILAMGALTAILAPLVTAILDE